ncbi:MAG TPA: universal stress protein [Thermoanaerobaculia bacterium]|nr:universal stress protein [Thermoanaerobaculia bacterium]
MSRYSYDRILVPTDMSEFAELALRYAGLFRERTGSSLTLLFADEMFLPGELIDTPLGFYLENAPPSRWKLQQLLRAWGNEHLGGRFETLVLQQSPTRAILHAVKDIAPQLVIMGTHGRRGLRRAILGSVTENLLHETDVPVLTVTPALMGNRKDVAIRRILCPVNFTYVAREALMQAGALAETLGAELTVMYVAEAVDQNRIADVESAFRHWVDPQVACSFTHIFLQDGDPAERVLAVSGEIDADLIVVGAQHKFFSDATVIGTTTARITRFARIPVLTVARKARKEILDPEHELANVM